LDTNRGVGILGRLLTCVQMSQDRRSRGVMSRQDIDDATGKRLSAFLPPERSGKPGHPCRDNRAIVDALPGSSGALPEGHPPRVRSLKERPRALPERAGV
jgi:hypothetical protein